MWNTILYISFIRTTKILVIHLYKTISIKNNLKQNITLFRSIAFGFFKVLTAEMVKDLDDNHHNKPKLALKRSKSLL